MDVTPHPFWLVALAGGCTRHAEYARRHVDLRAALGRLSKDQRHQWLEAGGFGCFGGGFGDGDVPTGSGGGTSAGSGDGEGSGGSGSGGGNTIGNGSGDGYGYSDSDGNNDGHGRGYGVPFRVRVGGEWWDRERALAWIAPTWRS